MRCEKLNRILTLGDTLHVRKVAELFKMYYRHSLAHLFSFVAGFKTATNPS